MEAIRIESLSSDLKYAVNAFFESGTLGCYTCNTCTVECPVNRNVGRLDPRKVVRMTAFGMKEELLESVDIWLCMQCRKCSNVCPQKVEPAPAIYFFRNLALKENRVTGEFTRFIDQTERYIQEARKQAYTLALGAWRGGKAFSVEEVIKKAFVAAAGNERNAERSTSTLKVEHLVSDGLKETGFTQCLTCRECTVSCIVSRSIGSFDPVKIMRTYYLGQEDKILASPDLWLCISCETCSEVCKQGVRGSVLISRLKSLAIEREIMPPGIMGELAEIDRALHEIRAEVIYRAWENRKETRFFDLSSEVEKITGS